MKTTRYCLALDLKDDPELIKEYEKYHEKIWPEITESIVDGGVVSSQIYRLETRMFMILEVDDTFSFEKKAKADEENPKVQEWEDLMWKYQQSLPWAAPGQKWMLMDKVFDLKENG